MAVTTGRRSPDQPLYVRISLALGFSPRGSAWGALEAMGALGMPAALLDRTDVVRDTNALMTPALIGMRGGGRIVLGHLPGDAALANILAGQSSARSIALPATDDRPGRIVHVLPLIGAARDIFAGSLSLLVMHVADGTPVQPDLAILRALFDLSPAEARLTEALATGRDLAQIAKDCNIRVSTARSYLETILRKTGVHRQGELVALIADSVGHRDLARTQPRGPAAIGNSQTSGDCSGQRSGCLPFAGPSASPMPTVNGQLSMEL